MSYEDPTKVLAVLQNAVRSESFQELFAEKFYPKVEALAEDLLQEAASPRDIDWEDMAIISLPTLDSFLTLLEIIPLPTNPVDSLVMEIVRSYVFDTTPLFHAYLTDVLNEADKASRVAADAEVTA